MTKLHTFGCSITQGFALPDTIQPILDDHGQPLTPRQIQDRNLDIDWNDIHIYQPSQYAWPKVLADQLGLPVENHARRGACFYQIARQCAMAAPYITPTDTVIVMWTYLSRISLQWPARTSVPLCTVIDQQDSKTNILPGFNKFFGLERSTMRTQRRDQHVYKFIHDFTEYIYLNPMGFYDNCYNKLILAQSVDGLLRSTGATVIHLSVETQPHLDQLEEIRQLLPKSLNADYTGIPDPSEFYRLDVDHHSCLVILDPSIPPAENDMHPSITHHSNFAQHIHQTYFSGSR